MPDSVNHVSMGFMILCCLLGIFLPLPTFRAYYNGGSLNAFSGCNMIAINCLLCLQYIVNAIIWPTQNINNWWNGTGLCDIQAALKYPVTQALAISLWRFMSTLASVVSERQFELSHAEKRRRFLTEALWCWLLPVVQIFLSYLIRKGRYTILPVIGCEDLLDDSWLKFLIITIWCPIAMLLTSYSASQFFHPAGFFQERGKCGDSMKCELTVLFLVCIIVRVLKHRRNISGLIVSGGSGIRDRQFNRMAILSLGILLFYIPVQGMFFINAISSGITRYNLFDNYSKGWTQPNKATLADYGSEKAQYIGYTSAVWNIMFFLFTGFERESRIESRKMAIALGLARFWPSLAQPLPPRCRTAPSERSWLKTNRLTSWLFNPVTLRLDPCGNLFAWLATSPRLDQWTAGKVGTFFRWIEQSMNSISMWFRRYCNLNWYFRHSITQLSSHDSRRRYRAVSLLQPLALSTITNEAPF
jgi:Pheromone A receptor